MWGSSPRPLSCKLERTPAAFRIVRIRRGGVSPRLLRGEESRLLQNDCMVSTSSY